MNLKIAAALAQALSLLVCVMIARWYFVPWLRNQERANALIALL